MRVSREKRIGEVLYRTNSLGGRAAMGVFVGLVKIIGPALAELGISVYKSGTINVDDPEKSDISEELLGKAVTLLASRLDEDHVVNLICRLLSDTTRVDPTMGNQSLSDPAMFDVVYSGEGLRELPGAIMFALEVNYGHFLGSSGSIGGILGRLKTMASSAQSPKLQPTT